MKKALNKSIADTELSESNRFSTTDQRTSRPFIVPVFVPHCGCQHQCAFCNQRAITGTPSNLPSPEALHHQITSFLRYRRADRSGVQIAFFGGNFLGLTSGQVKSLLGIAQTYISEGRVDSIRFSTRPETITPKRLDWLQDFSIGTIELGAQSMQNSVLQQIQRGHRAEDTINAVKRLRHSRYEIGLQMMVGLPGEGSTGFMRTGRALVKLKPEFVRIYPTLVLKNSLLARWFDKGKYSPLSLDQAVEKTKLLLRLFERHKIPVIRMGLQASAELSLDRELLAGPYHPAFGHLVHSALFLDEAIAALSKTTIGSNPVDLYTHPASISRMRGLKNSNVAILKEKFNIRNLRILQDDSLDRNELKVDCNTAVSSSK